ncbi:MAG: acetyl-CoA carboxylase biotin carboxyl carrier protein [Gammaproteobacteria bacterium]|nr:acetyl-CoA carboxylase biotin carboxyl carrier protein [Gammaproteobacteria bacterium]MDE2263927.1 acetyl-CoA carboxylase biotin carboxyl carrier protein [Gammaproteobacteria bacterium]
MTLTAKDVAEITRLLEESSFDEMTLELDGLKLTMRRIGAAAPAGASMPEVQKPTAAPPEDEPAPSAVPAQLQAGSAATAAATQDIPAPLLGTFYRAPKPGAPPFVEVGSAVEQDTIIGIIEVMKLMNTVRAGMRGKVADILAKDGALVEYGETLMRVSKATLA